MHCVAVVVVVVVWRGISNCILTAPWGYKTNDKPSRAGTYICIRMYIMHIWIRMYVFKKLTSKISCSSVNKPKTTAASIDPYRMSNLATRCFCIRSMFPSPFTHTHTRTLIIICRLDPDPDPDRDPDSSRSMVFLDIRA